MKIVLDEYVVLDKALKDGIVDNRPTLTILVLAKHYLGEGCERDQVIFNINNFMCKHYQGYIFANWQKTIKNIVDRINRKGDFNLVDVREVRVYKEELDVIRSMFDLKFEKLAFTLLVYAKIYNILNKNNTNWVNAEFKDVLNDTGMRISRHDGALMVYELKKKGLVQPSKVVDSTNIKVLFAEDDGDIAFKVLHFDNIIDYYLQWIEPDKYMNCEVCGVPVRRTSNRRKYCDECGREIRTEQNRSKSLKYYHKSKDFTT